MNLTDPPILKWLDGIELHPITEDGPSGETKWTYRDGGLSAVVESHPVDFTHPSYARFGATVSLRQSICFSRYAADPQTALNLATGEAAYWIQRMRPLLDRFNGVTPIPPEPRGL